MVYQYKGYGVTQGYLLRPLLLSCLTNQLSHKNLRNYRRIKILDLLKSSTPAAANQNGLIIPSNRYMFSESKRDYTRLFQLTMCELLIIGLL